MREDAIVVRDRRRFGEQVKAAALVASGGVSDECDVVMDAVMGDFFKGWWDNLAKTGRYVVYGAADLTPAGDLGLIGWVKLAWNYVRRPFVDPMNLPGVNKSVMGFNLIWMFDKIVELGELLAGLEALKLKPPTIGRRFRFDELPTALRTFQSGGTTGKVVVLVPDEEEEE